jgi:Rv2175c C-terminal domain of unknown function/DNA-binding protein Rv2175c, wHTH domain
MTDASTEVQEAGVTTQWLTVPEVAEIWGSDVLRVRQALKDHHLIAARLDGVLRVPRDFLAPDGPVKGLPGVLTLLADAGYTDDEAMLWLITPDNSLPGSPAQALSENRGREVKRRAQALVM